MTPPLVALERLLNKCNRHHHRRALIAALNRCALLSMNCRPDFAARCRDYVKEIEAR